MKKTLLITIFIFLLIAISLIAMLPNQQTTKTSNVKIATTIYPVFDIATNITKGTNTQVVNIIDPKANPHTFDPTIETKMKLKDATCTFVIGQNFDTWIKDIAPQSQIIDLSVNINIENNNPHYWLSIENARIIARDIKNQLVALDPENSTIYEQNYTEYTHSLDILKQSYLEKIQSVTNKKVITYHPAYTYLLREFNFELVKVISEHENQELTPNDLLETKKLIHTYDIHEIFVSWQMPQQNIDALQQELNTEIILLDPIGGFLDNPSYINLIKYNLDSIINAKKQ